MGVLDILGCDLSLINGTMSILRGFLTFTKGEKVKNLFMLIEELVVVEVTEVEIKNDMFISVLKWV